MFMLAHRPLVRRLLRTLLAAQALLLPLTTLPAHGALAAPQVVPIAASPPTSAAQPAAAPAPHAPDFSKLPSSFVPAAGQIGAIFSTPQGAVLAALRAAEQDQDPGRQIDKWLDPWSNLLGRVLVKASENQNSVARLPFVGANPTPAVLERSADVVPASDSLNGTLILVYAEGDHSLPEEMQELINAAERTADNSANFLLKLKPLAALDYLLKPDSPDGPLCPSYIDHLFTGTLVLIYANGDNSLDEEMQGLINAAERAAGNPAIKILLALDGPGEDDSYLYLLKHDPSDDPLCPSYIDHLCNGRYREGQSVWKWSESMANRFTLAEFLRGAIRANPRASRVVLSLVGHGGGWSPDVTGGQPSWHDPQPDGLGGLLSDSHPASALSTADLGWALGQARQARGRPLDLLYLDACNMAAAEVAYEVGGSVQYLLASENTKWAIFPYEEHLNSIRSGMDGRAIGAAWLADEVAALEKEESDPFLYPYTYSLTDLTKISAIVSRINSLAQTLTGNLAVAANQNAIQQALAKSGCFDSNQDNKINAGDNSVPNTSIIDTTCDLASFAHALAMTARATRGVTNADAIATAAQELQGAMDAAVLVETHRSGRPWIGMDQEWHWNDLGGLSIYVPLKADESRRSLYGTLRFGRDSGWAAFLNAWWNRTPHFIDPPRANIAFPPELEKGV